EIQGSSEGDSLVAVSPTSVGMVRSRVGESLAYEPPWRRGWAARNRDLKLKSARVYRCPARVAESEISRARRPDGEIQGSSEGDSLVAVSPTSGGLLNPWHTNHPGAATGQRRSGHHSWRL
ncbi:MAG: hypothetical protein ACK2T3_10245, partial [Candidatus Promineifilaceae bacterium]